MTAWSSTTTTATITRATRANPASSRALRVGRITSPPRGGRGRTECPARGDVVRDGRKRTTAGRRGKAFALEHERDLGLGLLRTVAHLLALVVDLRDIDLALALRRQVLARGHREHTCERGRDARDEDRVALAGRAADGARDRERADDAVLHPEERLAYLAEQIRFATLLLEMVFQPRAIEVAIRVGPIGRAHHSCHQITRPARPLALSARA